MKQPSLFSEPRGWKEVHQETFLSWPEASQLRYCAHRDFDSAVQAEEHGDLELAEWYQERGTLYLGDAQKCIPNT